MSANPEYGIGDYYGILYACPRGARGPDCPIRSKDKTLFVERVKWFVSLTEIEQQQIIAHHIECTRQINNKKQNHEK